MAVKGTNHQGRKTRLSRAYLRTSEQLEYARVSGRWSTVDKLRHRQTTIRIAWQRLDDHLYPKGR